MSPIANPLTEYSMDNDLQILEVASTDSTVHYQFVVDADLVHVGGGTGLMDY